MNIQLPIPALDHAFANLTLAEPQHSEQVLELSLFKKVQPSKAAMGSGDECRGESRSCGVLGVLRP